MEYTLNATIDGDVYEYITTVYDSLIEAINVARAESKYSKVQIMDGQGLLIYVIPD